MQNNQSSTNNTIRLIGEDAQRKQKKSCGASRDDTLVSQHSKKLRFRKNSEDVCNQLNSVSWVELMGSCTGVKSKSHVQK